MDGRMMRRMVREYIEALTDGFGGRAGNIALLQYLQSYYEGWDEETYWEVRDEVLGNGEIELGRGRGGSVSILEKTQELESFGGAEGPGKNGIATPCLPESRKEADYYPEIQSGMEGFWRKVKGRRIDRFRVLLTADQGSKNTGGKWTRPDLVVASKSVFYFVPDSIFDLTTFEVKIAERLDITAVYEALSHRRFVNNSYLYCVGEAGEVDEELLQATKTECERHGVGLIFSEAPSDSYSWDELVKPH